MLAVAEAVLSDPARRWEECGARETDGPAVLMDSAEAGADLGAPYPDGRGRPAEAPVAVPAGRWEVRACHKTGEFPWVGIAPSHDAPHGAPPARPWPGLRRRPPLVCRLRAPPPPPPETHRPAARCRTWRKAAMISDLGALQQVAALSWLITIMNAL
ncbi:Imm21 family immunity protein [Streptomyces sp. YH02]|uniref:Imm21 family immunity protein n=1 Tax=Streptomyces sp. YH02 TaxID=3256999 RepID=UPI003756871F